jgi:hypothetical protein
VVLGDRFGGGDFVLRYAPVPLLKSDRQLQPCAPPTRTAPPTRFRFFDGVGDLRYDLTGGLFTPPVVWLPLVAGVGEVDGAAAVHRHPGWSIF